MVVLLAKILPVFVKVVSVSCTLPIYVIRQETKFARYIVWANRRRLITEGGSHDRRIFFASSQNTPGTLRNKQQPRHSQEKLMAR
jgi:hypothetical protein